MKSPNSSQPADLEWDMAIHDAELELVEAEQRVVEAKRRVCHLRGALRTFRENKADGVPWPKTDGLWAGLADSCVPGDVMEKEITR